MNIHIYPSPISFASRILRETEALSHARLFHSIEIVGTEGEGVPAFERVDDVRAIRRHAFRSTGASGRMQRLLALPGWVRTVRAHYKKERLQCVNAHSLTVLPLAAQLAKATGVPLIYDTHELETETVAASPLRRWMGKRVERWYMPQIAHTFVVSEGIAEWYRKTYHTEAVSVVRNAPALKEISAARQPDAPSHLREALGVPDDALVFLYQGKLSRGRGIEPMLDAFRTSGRHRR